MLEEEVKKTLITPACLFQAALVAYFRAIFFFTPKQIAFPLGMLIFPITKMTHWCVFNLFFFQEHHYHVHLFLIL